MAHRLDTRTQGAPQLDMSYRRPLGLESWQAAFDPQNGRLLDAEEAAAAPFSAKVSAQQLATRVAQESIRAMPDERTRGIAEIALMSTISNQASRNDRYNTPHTHTQLAELYPAELHRAITFGTAPLPDLASVVAADNIPVASLELARHSHGNNWRHGDNINQDTRSEIFETDLDAQPLKNEPNYKIKGFYDAAVLIERKRKIASLLGGKVTVVMRLNMLIDQSCDDIQPSVSQLIDYERSQLERRQGSAYDFSKENTVLKKLLDDYVRTPVDRKALNFLTPLQTGYYVYSPEKHADEKELDHRKRLQQKASEAANREYWLGSK